MRLSSQTTFGELLKRYRMMAGFTQEALAEKANISTKTISSLERYSDRLPRLETVTLLANALDLNEEQRRHLLAVARQDPLNTQLDGANHHENSKSIPNNLPLQLTSFIGREQVMARIKDLLSTTRLLSLTGAGGTGKTRLALEVASDLLGEYPDGVWFIELAALNDSTLISQSVATVLGLGEEASRPTIAVICDYFRTKTALLILDNCEHLIEASARLADATLQAAPQLKILATSREVLGLVCETTYPVPTLTVPPPDANLGDIKTLTQYEAVRLFIGRALAVQPDFDDSQANASAVAQICQRLDGLPLALELAAARMRSMSVEQLAARLDNRFRLLTGGSRTALPRQQTLRAAIEWSYDLLTDEERILWRWLSVFTGGWTLEAAQAVGEMAQLGEEDVLDLLQRLVDKSLIQFVPLKDGSRYQMLESLQEYGRDKLLETQEMVAARNQHLDHFLKLAQQAETQLIGSAQFEWLERLDKERDNFRMALKWSLNHGPIDAGLALIDALRVYWDLRIKWSEGIELATQLLAHPQAAAPTLLRGQGLLTAAYIYMNVGERATGGRYLDELIAIAPELGNAGHRILALGLCLSVNHFYRNNPEKAESLLEQAFNLAHPLNDEWLSGNILRASGRVFFSNKEYHSARQQFEASMEQFRSVGDQYSIARVSLDLSLVDFLEGDLSKAQQGVEQNLMFHRRVKNQKGICIALTLLGEIARTEERYDLARDFYAEALEIAHDLGMKSALVDLLLNFGFVALHDGDLDSARTHFAADLSLAQESGREDQLAFVLMGFGDLAAVEGNAPRAVRLFAAASTIEFDKRAITPADEAEQAHYLSLARTQLDETNFAIAWEEGHAMTLEQAIKYALNEDRNEVD